MGNAFCKPCVAKKVSGFGGAELVRSTINGTILGTTDERPKTATLKRPSILDESLKDKVRIPMLNIMHNVLLYCYLMNLLIFYHGKIGNYRLT